MKSEIEEKACGNYRVFQVQNADGEKDTTAQIIVQNEINYEPKVSVIIPVYNVEKYLSKCLDTVLNQTLKEIEVICVNDGSTDNSLQILREYAQRDRRVTVVSRENKGVGYSRNEGMKLATGEFVAFMDPDDYYPDASVLEVMYSKAVEHNVKICGGSLIVYDENRKVEIKRKGKWDCFTEDKIHLYRDFQYDYGFQRYIYDRGFLNRNKIFFPHYRRFQDPPFMVNAFMNAGEFYALKLYVYAYRYSPEKTIAWTEEKVYHLLNGLRDNLDLSRGVLPMLYATTMFRIKSEYKSIINSFNTERIRKIREEILDKSSHFVQGNIHMDRQPDVSVIVPVYNVTSYLNQCLNSIIHQTLKNIEIICVNDGSTDNSLNIIKEYADKDNRIKYIDKPNAGYGHAMNTGLEVATGKYIGIVEPDDFIKPEMYELLYGKAEKLGLDMIKSDYVSFSDKDEKYVSIVQKSLYDKILLQEEVKGLGFTLNPVGLFKNTFLKKYSIMFNETPGASHQDIGFWLLTTLYSQRIYFVPSAFYMYRQDNAQSSMNSFAEPSIMFNEYSFVRKHLEQHPDVWNRVKEIYFRRRHKSLMYFGTKRVSPQDQLPFRKKLKALYQSDLREINFLVFLNDDDRGEVERILQQDLENKEIPIVYATDKKYSEAAHVSIKSLKFFASSESVYHIYVLHTDLSADEEQKFEELSERNVFISCLNICNSKYLDQSLFYTCAHYSVEMYYRILIPKLLPQYRKVIYVDCDTLFIQDIGRLYQEDIVNGIIAGVINPVKSREKYVRETLSLDPEKYFNSGVLLINTSEWESFHTTEKCIDFLSKHQNLECPDQDTLNVVCQSKVFFLDVKWNWQWAWDLNGIRLPEYCAKSYWEALPDLAVIHYTTGKKPWNVDGTPIARIWHLFSAHKNDEEYIWKYLSNHLYPYLLEHYCRGAFDHHQPRTLDEKIQWLRIFDQTPTKVLLTDKYHARVWLREKIGEKYLIPLLGVYDRFSDIDFNRLPNQFVIKYSQDSGCSITVKDKSQLNLSSARQKVDRWARENRALKCGFNPHYQDIMPKILIEEYIATGEEKLHHYNFWCINGKVKFVQFRDANLKMVFYDLNWERQPFYYDHSLYERELAKPDNLDEMIRIAKTCCKDFAFVCVGLYHLNDGTIKFAEMTFTHSRGFTHWNDEKYNLMLGNLVRLPKMSYAVFSKKYRISTNRYADFFANLYRARNLNKRLLNLLVLRLLNMRIDIKNIGQKNNEVMIEGNDVHVDAPTWFSDSKGKGQTVTSNSRRVILKVQAIGSGLLSFAFRGIYCAVGGKMYPVWIDYRSIKIDGKEILAESIQTWHNKPFRYEMTVSDGQKVLVELEQNPHFYSLQELTELLPLLVPRSEQVANHTAQYAEQLYKQLKQQNY